MSVAKPPAEPPYPAGESQFGIDEPIFNPSLPGGGTSGDGGFHIPELPGSGAPLPGQGADGQPLPGFTWAPDGTIKPVGAVGSTPTAPGAGPDPTAASSARGIIAKALADIGLEDMTEWAYGQLTAGNAPEEILVNLRQQDRYKQRFIANDYRKKNGLNPLSESEIIAYENSYRSLLTQYGLPGQLYSSTDTIAQAIGKGLNIPQINDRIQQGFVKVANSPAMRDQFRDWYGPDGDVALAMYFMDTDRALPLLEKQVGTATLGAVGTRYGFTLGKQRAEELASQGINTDQSSVQDVFARLARIDPIFHETVSENTDLTAEGEGLDALLGLSHDAQTVMDRRLAERDAAFKGSSAGGVTVGREHTGFATADSGQ